MSEQLLGASYPPRETATLFVLDEVSGERDRQEAKWGEQNHPDGTGGDHHLFRTTSRETYAWLATLAKSTTDHYAETGSLTFADVFVEEVFEALAEENSTNLRAELIQVAAVAVAWVEAIDRRSA